MQVAKGNLNIMKKWSEICCGSTKMLSAVQLRVLIVQQLYKKCIA